MSTWYQYKVKAIADDQTAVGKFFHLDPKEDVRIDDFEFSFGQKNGPGLYLEKLMKQNPDLIFLVEQQIECNYIALWIERFDKNTSKFQHIFIEKYDYDDYEVNKSLLEKYAIEFPNLMAQHEKSNRPLDWKYFFNDFNKCALMLSQADMYQQMISPISEEEIEFDNAELVE